MKSRVWEYAPVKYEGTAPYDKFFNIFFLFKRKLDAQYSESEGN